MDTFITSLSLSTIHCTKSRDKPTPKPQTHALYELTNISQNTVAYWFNTDAINFEHEI